MQLKKILQETWNTKWERRTIIATGLIILFWILPLLSDGPYTGRVLDESDGRPIKGVLVLAQWRTTTIGPAGGSTRCKDAYETLTDEAGEFTIPKRWTALFRPLGRMDICLYKVGYARLGAGLWKSFRLDSLLAEKVKWEGERVIVPLARIPKAKLKTAMGAPPLISCGPRNNKPMTEYKRVKKEYFETIRKK